MLGTKIMKRTQIIDCYREFLKKIIKNNNGISYKNTNFVAD